MNVTESMPYSSTLLDLDTHSDILPERSTLRQCFVILATHANAPQERNTRRGGPDTSRSGAYSYDVTEETCRIGGNGTRRRNAAAAGECLSRPPAVDARI